MSLRYKSTIVIDTDINDPPSSQKTFRLSPLSTAAVVIVHDPTEPWLIVTSYRRTTELFEAYTGF